MIYAGYYYFLLKGIFFFSNLTVDNVGCIPAAATSFGNGKASAREV